MLVIPIFCLIPTPSTLKMITKASVVIVLIATLLSGCNKEETEKYEEMPKLEATTPFREDTSVTKEYVCQIHAIRHIEVRALERGYLQGNRHPIPIIYGNHG